MSRVIPEAGVKERVGLWEFHNIARNFIKIYPHTSPHKITMTGSAVETQLQIPFMHRLNKLIMYHTDSSYAASAVALDIYLDRKAGQNFPPKFEERVFKRLAYNKAKATIVLGERYEYEASVYTLSLNSTNTHLIFPVLYIQRI